MTAETIKKLFNIGLYTLKYFLFNHTVKDIQKFETPSVIDRTRISILMHASSQRLEALRREDKH